MGKILCKEVYLVVGLELFWVFIWGFFVFIMFGLSLGVMKGF